MVPGLFRRCVPLVLRVLQTPFGHCWKKKSFRSLSTSAETQDSAGQKSRVKLAWHVILAEVTSYRSPSPSAESQDSAGQRKERVRGKDEEFVVFVVYFFIIDFWKPEALLVLRRIVCIWQTLLKFPEIGDDCNFLTNIRDKASLLKKCFFFFWSICV